MADIEGGVIIPKAVYFDTNILMQIGLNRPDPEFQRLMDHSKSQKFSMFCSELSVVEYIERLVRKAQEDFETIQKATVRLERLLLSNPFHIKSPIEFEAPVKALIEDKILSWNIKSIPNTKRLSIDELTSMAVKRIPPFEDNDKGFRDAVILETIKNHMIDNDFHKALLVSNDNIMKHPNIRDRFGVSKRVLDVVSSLKEANDSLEKYLSIKTRAQSEKKIRSALEFLNTEKEAIFKYILENISIYSTSLSGISPFASYKDDIPDGSSVERINEIFPQEITEVFIPQSDIDNPQVGYWESVLISVLVDVDMVISEPINLIPLLGQSIKYSESRTFGNSISKDWFERASVNLKVERVAVVDASIHTSSDGYDDLQLHSTWL